MRAFLRNTPPGRELYDHDADSKELKNLAADLIPATRRNSASGTWAPNLTEP